MEGSTEPKGTREEGRVMNLCAVAGQCRAAGLLLAALMRLKRRMLEHMQVGHTTQEKKRVLSARNIPSTRVGGA
jgi:hypothetical protein